MTKTTKMTWDEYKIWVSSLAKSKGTFFCRGHANDKWKLQTFFHREATHKNITLLQYLDVILPEVHYHITGMFNDLIDLRNEHELGAFLALIQHYGFPTPLLDWTLSPYMAAYFAFREVDEKHPLSDNIKIYIFDHAEWAKSFQQPLNLRDTTGKYVSIIRPYAKNNPRIIAQQGIFTVTNVDDMEQHIIANSAKKTFLYTVELSVKEKPHVMRELNLMGINEMTLFPGLGGVCRSLKNQFFSPDTVGLTPKEWKELLTKPAPMNVSLALGAGEGALGNCAGPKGIGEALRDYALEPETGEGGILDRRLAKREY